MDARIKSGHDDSICELALCARRTTTRMPRKDPGVAALMAKLKQNGIEYLRFELPDLHGISRSKTVPVDKVEGYARDGLNFYGGIHGARHVIERGPRKRHAHAAELCRPAALPRPRLLPRHPLARQDGERRLPRLRV